MSVNLDLKHPCKQLIWCYQKDKYLDNKNYDANENVDKNGTLKSIYNNFAVNINDDINPLINANLQLNGYDRMDKRLGTGTYYNVVQGYQYNTNSPNTGIYSYSFGIFPEELQPSGACNFSRFQGQTLQFDLDENMFYYSNSDINPTISEYKKYLYTDVILNLYAKGYNVIRINGGFSALAFSFN
jgi:hypothetical protein